MWSKLEETVCIMRRWNIQWDRILKFRQICENPCWAMPTQWNTNQPLFLGGSSRLIITLIKNTVVFQILIANRGEIALRISVPVKRWEIKDRCSLFHLPDKESLLCRFADEAVLYSDQLQVRTTLILNISRNHSKRQKFTNGAMQYSGYGFYPKTPNCSKNLWGIWEQVVIGRKCRHVSQMA